MIKRIKTTLEMYFIYGWSLRTAWRVSKRQPIDDKILDFWGVK